MEFSAVPFDGIPEIDWIFFYSQNGVRFFFENISTDQLADVKLATIGPGTAACLAEVFRSANFIGDGAAKTSAETFLPFAEGKKVLFPRAANSRRSVQLELGDRVQSFDLVVYENLPKSNITLPDFDVLVFTSPLNAQAYFSQKKWREGQRVVAIGKTTANALAGLRISKVEVAERPSEEGLAEAVLSR